MTILGDRSHIEVDCGDGRIAIFGGELGFWDFYADKDCMRWKFPHDQEPVSETDCALLISMIEKENEFRESKIIFNSKKISREEFIANFSF